MSHNFCTIHLAAETLKDSEESSDKNTFGRSLGGQVLSVAAFFQALTRQFDKSGFEMHNMGVDRPEWLGLPR